MPPPRPGPPSPPLPPLPPIPPWPFMPAAPMTPPPKPPPPPLPPVTTGSQIGADGAVRDAQRAGGIENTAAFGQASVCASGAITPHRAAARSVRPVQPETTHGDVVHDSHRGKRDPSARVQNACALGSTSVLNRQLRDRDGATEHLEDSIELIAVNDGACRARAFDRDLSFQVEVAGRAGVLVGSRNRQRERSRRAR